MTYKCLRNTNGLIISPLSFIYQQQSNSPQQQKTLEQMKSFISTNNCEIGTRAG